MKVIVCFDSVRVIVPCGDGEILVRELITKAIHRYKKATGKAGSHWVNVHNLKTISGGGILDPDDQLQDVCDDREQLIADFEEEGRPLHHNGGDGASASSTGTTSPDIFQGSEDTSNNDNDNDAAELDGAGATGGDVQEQEQGPGPPTPTHRPPSPPRRPLSPPPPKSPRSPTPTRGVTISPTFPLLPRQAENGKTDILVTAVDFSIGSKLRVRRGSEPALSTLGDEAIQKPLIPISNGLIASLHRRESVRESDEPRSESSDEDGLPGGHPDKKKKTHLSRFSRDAFRTSLSNRPNMFVWIEAQERAEEKAKQVIQVQEERKGPVGASVSETDTKPKKQEPSSTDCLLICLKNDGGPLGIHVVPASDDNGRDMGLMIQSVEPGGRIHKDGRLGAEDRIVEINGADLASVTFTRAQEIFRSAMKTDEIRLKVVKRKPPKPAARTKGQPPAVLPKPRHIPAKPSPLTLPQKTPDGAQPQTSPNQIGAQAQHEPPGSASPGAANGESTLKSFYVSSTPKSSSLSKSSSSIKSSSTPKSSSSSSISMNGGEGPSTSTLSVVPKKSQPIKPGPPIRASSPTKKTPPAVPVRHPTTSLTSQLKERPINALTNTRKIGKKIRIDLKKGPLGLGFSVTSRDNMTGGDVPIYIKNVLPKGAAIQDGRLKPGDRMLEVNGIPMAGKTQAEVVTMLRNTPQGSLVSLLVSRQEEVDERFTVPREMATDKQETTTTTDSNANTIVTQHDQTDVKDDAKTLQPPEQVVEDDSPGSEKHPTEVIRLEIPLNDSGSAGLGVSVKGTTLTTDAGPKDLGIFVKAVMHGGAASKDGRLMLNDQLLEVNGVNLRGLPNVVAMESLRQAMMAQDPSKRYIQLTVARRVGVSSPFMYSEHSPDSSQSGEMVMRHYRTRSDLSQQSDYVDSTPYHSRQNSSSKMSDSDVFSGDRTGSLTSSLEKVSNGQSMVSGSSLRNESYMRATNDSLNDSSAFREAGPSPGAFKTVEKSRNKMAAAPTVTPSANQGDEIIIEEDTYAQPVKSHLRQRPHSTIGFAHLGSSGEGEGDGYEEEYGKEPFSPADDSDLSPTDAAITFQREGFGRQSMSEKRKGHVDPRTLEIYQRAKASKEQKEKTSFPCRRAKSFHVSGTESNPLDPDGTAASLHRSGSVEALPTTSTAPAPTTTNKSMLHDQQYSMYRPPAPASHEVPLSNLKRSSSLEDLSQPEAQMEVEAEAAEEQDDQVPVWRLGRLGRVRACNESFRAAVDRSYDPLGDPGLMDTLEEESMESGSFSVGQRSTSERSSFSSENTADNYDSLKNKKKSKDKKGVGGGIFKGFWRLGKGRKSTEDIGHAQGRSRSRSEERPSHLVVNRDPDALQRMRKHSQQEMDDGRIQEQYRRIQEQQQRQLEHQQQLQQQLHQQQQQLQQQQQQLQQQLQQQQLQQQQQQRLASSSSIQSDLSSHSHPRSTGRNESPSRPYQQDLRSQFPAVGRSSGARRGEGNSALAGQAMSRAERIQQLRLTHQQQHQARQGVYPHDQEEEMYEEQIREDERRHVMVAEVHQDIRGRHEMWPAAQGRGEPGSNYGQQYSRSSNQRNEMFRNSPFTSVSSMNSDTGNYSHHGNHLYAPPHTTLSGYDPHHHFHHHHHDVYDQQYDNQYMRRGGGDHYMDQSRGYYEEGGSRGLREPSHLTGYSGGGQRPVQRFTDPGSAKV